mgnify:CR=1 FL=1
MKSDASPLTRADREANAIICQALQNISPHIPIISEENKLTPHAVRQVSASVVQYFAGCGMAAAGTSRARPKHASNSCRRATCGPGAVEAATRVRPCGHLARTPVQALIVAMRLQYWEGVPGWVPRQQPTAPCLMPLSNILRSSTTTIRAPSNPRNLPYSPPPRPHRSSSTTGWWIRWTAPRSSSSATASSRSTSRSCAAPRPSWAWWTCPARCAEKEGRERGAGLGAGGWQVGVKRWCRNGSAGRWKKGRGRASRTFVTVTMTGGEAGPTLRLSGQVIGTRVKCTTAAVVPLQHPGLPPAHYAAGGRATPEPSRASPGCAFSPTTLSAPMLPPIPMVFHLPLP